MEANMGNTLLEISVPLDKDCFIEMECDFCKNRFMLHQEVYESEDNINFYCPICGLPNKINTFFVPEVLQKAQQMAMNYMLDELNRTLGKSIKQINKGGFIEMSMKSQKKEPDKELYTPSVDYIKCVKKCCNIAIKVMDIDKETGTYCPVYQKAEIK